MERRDPDGRHERDAPTVPTLREPVSASALSHKRLVHLWMLQGGHPTTFNDAHAHADVVSKRHVQAFAIGEVDSVKHLVEGKGPETVLKMVGWIRAALDEVVPGEPPWARVERVDIDRTVDPQPVRDFLVRRLQERIARDRRRIAGLSVHVPLDDVETAASYLSHGFDFDVEAPDALTWTPSRT